MYTWRKCYTITSCNIHIHYDTHSDYTYLHDTFGVYNVRAKEKAGDKYLMTRQCKRRDMTQKTFWQATRYFLVFFISMVPFYIFAFYDCLRLAPPDWVTILYVILWPNFGVFNSFVYFRQRYLSYKLKNPQSSCIKGYLVILELDCCTSKTASWFCCW